MELYNVNVTLLLCVTAILMSPMSHPQSHKYNYNQDMDSIGILYLITVTHFFFHTSFEKKSIEKQRNWSYLTHTVNYFNLLFQKLFYPSIIVKRVLIANHNSRNNL